MSLEYQYVTDGVGFDKAMNIFRNADVLALDTEFVRTRTYYPELGLLQVSDGEHCFLFDPLILDLNIFSEILLNNNITKVLHSCSEDLEVFQHAFGVLPRPIYDTQISSSFLGLGFSVSYQTLVEHYLSLRIEKDQTRSNWLARPLSKRQLDYAAQDVVYLYEVYKIQQSAINETHKADWIISDLEKISFDIPTITPAEPFNADNQIFFFFFFVISEFQTSGANENFSKNLFSQSGVKTISGSKISACLPWSKHVLTVSK